MKILIVDDLTRRHDFLSGLYPGDACDSAWTVDEAIEKLQAEPYDLVFLDYDLEEGTSVTVAEHLAGLVTQPVVILHTDNPAGAEQLRQHLPEAVVFPVTEMTRGNPRFSRLKAAIAAGDLERIRE